MTLTGVIATLIMTVLGIGFGFMLGREVRDWTPPPHRTGSPELNSFYEDWEDFQASRRSDEVDALTILNWETEIEETRVN